MKLQFTEKASAKINCVDANPELTGSEADLTSIQIDGVNYKISAGGGTDVVANPELEGNEDALTGIEVGETKYKVPAQVNSDWNASSGVAEILNKPTIPDAVSGTYEGTKWTSITIGNTTKGIPQVSGNQLQYFSLKNLMTKYEYNHYSYDNSISIKDVCHFVPDEISNYSFHYSFGEYFSFDIPTDTYILGDISNPVLVLQFNGHTSGSGDYDIPDYVDFNVKLQYLPKDEEYGADGSQSGIQVLFDDSSITPDSSGYINLTELYTESGRSFNFSYDGNYMGELTSAPIDMTFPNTLHHYHTGGTDNDDTYDVTLLTEEQVKNLIYGNAYNLPISFAYR